MPSVSSNATVSTTSTSATKRTVNEIHTRSMARTPEQELARQIVPRLAARSYHLPGYGKCKDWLQYMFNNHPLLGICCHHRLHPLKMKQRIFILLGSFAFGVAITNAIYLWFLHSGRDDKEEVFSVDLSASLGQKEQSNPQHFSVTSGLIVLLTVGSGSHALFDRFIWSLSACKCCQSGGRFETRSCLKDLGYYLVIFLVTGMIAFATCIVVVRASLEEGETAVPIFQNRTKEEFQELVDFNDFALEDYGFVKGYAIEFAVSLFGYYPLIETLLFSGILGCYSVPILGGRPYAMKREAARTQQSGTQSVCPSELA